MLYRACLAQHARFVVHLPQRDASEAAATAVGNKSTSNRSSTPVPCSRKSSGRSISSVGGYRRLCSCWASRVLDAIQAHGGIGGVRLFFDADMSCPRLFCPRNESDWLSQCRRGTAYADGVRAPKNHWKPIVIPSRQVAVHQFWPSPPYLRKQVWSICFLHRAAPSPTESDTEQDQFELRQTQMIGPGGSDLSLLV